MRHIRRDGAFLCKKDIGTAKRWYKDAPYIKFKEAHKADLDKEFTEQIPPYQSINGEKTRTHRHFCADCVIRYFEILNNMKEIIVIDG